MPDQLRAIRDISYLLSGRASNSSSLPGTDDDPFASSLGRCARGLSRDKGLKAESTSRGEALSARENDAALGERGYQGKGTRFGIEGEDIGMLEVCDRNAEKLGTEIGARGICFLTVSDCVTAYPASSRSVSLGDPV